MRQKRNPITDRHRLPSTTGPPIARDILRAFKVFRDLDLFARVVFLDV